MINPPMQRADPRLRLAFYGDDFTGSTDALEVLAFAGLRCALFLKVPDAATLRDLGPFDAIGVAGDSRGMSPAEMDVQLAPVLAALAHLPAALVHYKVCSTFDSSPTIGSIGRVMELARSSFGDGTLPIVAGTPGLARYCVFGNLYARSNTDGQVHRIDRHPIMSVHPVTPMTEADLALHLGAQTSLPIAKFTLPSFALDRASMDREVERLVKSGAAAVLFDGTTAAQMTDIGRLLEGLCRDRGRPVFAVGGSGLEYAMTQWWRASGTTENSVPDYAHFDPVSQVLAVSGSASPLSALQIDAALAAGFVDLPIDAQALVAGDGWQQALNQLAEQAIAALRRGASVMLHTARGPQDARIATMLDALIARGKTRNEAKHEGGRLLGQRLGLLVDAILNTVPLRRLLLSGGDTSSQITQKLAPEALVVAARLAPGAPLCRVLSRQPHLHDLQIALKGGQMGQADYFVRALRGSAAA